MPSPTASTRRPGRPPATSLPQILAGAQTLIDREGWERLTIRRLADELGVGATTLYHHVRDKEDLLVHLLNELAAQTPRPDLPSEPRERIIVAAVALHDTLATWPWVVEILTTDGLMGRLGESALWMAEAMVAGAIDAGCPKVQAVDIFRSVWFYTVGEIMVRAHSPGGVDRSRLPGGVFFHGADISKLPHLAAIGNEWLEIEQRDIFRQGLEAIVDGLLAQAASASDR